MRKTVLKFGVPTLDKLLCASADDSGGGIHISPNRATSLSIGGPPGSGKSIAALHLASQYGRDNPEAHVIYISTDYDFEDAQNVCDDFLLFNKDRISSPFFQDRSAALKKLVAAHGRKSPHIEKVDPSSERVFTEIRKSGVLHFVDLKSTQAGDDWLFIAKLCAILNSPGKQSARHLVVIDGIEGLEIQAGETDIYGERHPERARVSHLIRLLHEKAHLCIVLESDAQFHRQEEEFVVDNVIRLGVKHDGGYLKRSVEVVKVRSHSHVRGEHRLLIRNGEGSTTEFSENPDDPRLEVDAQTGKCQAYMYVLHSLDAQAAMMKLSSRPAARKEIPGNLYQRFGIEQLDEMLLDGKGLAPGSVTAIIGPESTYRSRLGRAFLAEGYRRPVSANGDLTVGNCCTVYITHNRLPKLHLLLKTHVITKEVPRSFSKLDKEFLPPSANQRRRLRRIVYRRIEAQGMAAENLMHTVYACIYEGLVNLGKAKGKRNVENELRDYPYQVPDWAFELRVVIDDVSIFRKINPDVGESPRFNFFLLDFLKFSGTSCIVIETENGTPQHLLYRDKDSDFRLLVDNQIYTWIVKLAGENRVAVTCLPTITPGDRGRVRELLRTTKVGWEIESSADRIDSDALEADRHFELYRDLEGNSAELVGLEAHLVQCCYASKRYALEAQAVLNVSLGQQVYVCPTRSDRVENESNLSLLDRLNLTPSNLALSNTVVLQIDEWWVGATPESRANQRAWRNLMAMTSSSFQARTDYDEDILKSHPHEAILKRRNKESQDNRLVPYFWSFGFLLLRTRSWIRAWDHLKGDNMPPDTGRAKIIKRLAYRLIREVATGLTDLGKPYFMGEGFIGAPNMRDVILKELAEQQTPLPTMENNAGTTKGVAEFLDEIYPNVSQNVVYSWPVFLYACQLVAQTEQANNSGEPVSIFDVDLSGEESLNCLILEMWLSILSSLETAAGEDIECNVKKLSELLSYELAKDALYFALLLLSENIDVSGLATSDDGHDITARKASRRAIASRHWYSSAVEATRDFDPEDPLVPFRIPGKYSCRGDWYLGALKESRSEYLAELGIVALTTRTGARTRLTMGHGLPYLHLPDVDGTGGSDDTYKRLRTALPRPEMGRQSFVPYFNFKKLAPLDQAQTIDLNAPKALWRCRLEEYSLTAGVFRQWSFRVLMNLEQRRMSSKRTWVYFEDIYEPYIESLAKSSRKETMDERVNVARKQIVDIKRSTDFENLPSYAEMYLSMVRLIEAELKSVS